MLPWLPSSLFTYVISSCTLISAWNRGGWRWVWAQRTCWIHSVGLQIRRGQIGTMKMIWWVPCWIDAKIFKWSHCFDLHIARLLVFLFQSLGGGRARGPGWQKQCNQEVTQAYDLISTILNCYQFLYPYITAYTRSFCLSHSCSQ